MKRWILASLIFVAVERFCYFQTGTFSLQKMIYEGSPPSPTSMDSTIYLEQPLRFIGAGKQFYAFETADGKYVVKFMKWSRRRPPLFPNYFTSLAASRARLATNLQKSSLLGLTALPYETQLVTAQPVEHFTLIDKLGITHTVPSHFTHYYVQHKATSFIDHFERSVRRNPAPSGAGQDELSIQGAEGDDSRPASLNRRRISPVDGGVLQTHPEDAKNLLHSFIHTVATQCRQGISNLDPIIDRNYGVVDHHVILLDIGSLLASPKLHHTAAIHHEIVLELLPLRAYLQDKHPEHVSTFDELLEEEIEGDR